MENSPRQSQFISTLLKLMVPLTIQQLFNAGLALVDNIFIGQLGEVSVAATSLAYQIYFILILIYFGLNSGSAIFTAQYWGVQDEKSIRRVLGINLLINLSLGVLFTTVAIAIPEKLMSIYTADPEVITLGANYLRIYAIGYIAVGLSQAIYTILRSTENVRVPMIVNSLALVINTSLGYILIFGHFGVEKMGVMGAATANATARVIEIIILLGILVWSRSFLLRNLKDMFEIDLSFLGRFFKTCAPVIANEIFWSVGISAYNAIYAHISTESLAATNISSTVETLALVPFYAIGSATAVMIGNRIGAAEEPLARLYARWLLTIAAAGGVVMGVVMFFCRGWILSIYKISDNTTFYAGMVIAALSLLLPIKCWNMTMFIGVLRAGGDTRFGLILEMSTMWLFGVPAAWIGASLLHLPVYWVVVIVLSEEVLKGIIATFRFRSGKWIHNLIHSPVNPV